MATTMKPIDIRNVTVEGDLRGRLIKNFSRLHDPIFRAGMAGLSPCCSVGWPGDWEGRAMLALIHGEEALHTKAAYLPELIEWIYSLMNDEGYRSEPNDKLNLEDINEQMHSAQNWLMRAFMAYYRQTGDSKYLDDVKTILRNLYLPIKEHLPNYPRTANDRVVASDKAAIGHTTGHFREWRLSSDTGCIFMCFDALGEAWQLIDEEPLHTEIGELIDALLNEFRHMDYVAAELQTHASLTCMRGLMRVYRVKREKELLDIIEKYFDDFIKHGMTIHYANINNFGGAGHTEPCGIVDSYMLACQLWEETGKLSYLEMSHKIWWSALMRAQRFNGGFGCEWTGRDGFLRAHERIYEAFWCCTMRGAEGLAYPVHHALYEGEGTLTLPFYFDFTANLTDGETVSVQSDYPDKGTVCFTVKKGNGRKTILRFFRPQWMLDPAITINGAPAAFTEKEGFLEVALSLKAGTVCELTFEQALRVLPCTRFWHENEGRYTLEFGPLVLGCDPEFDGELDVNTLKPDGKGCFVSPDGTVFEPFHHDNLLEKEDCMAKNRRVLFKVKA